MKKSIYLGIIALLICSFTAAAITSDWMNAGVINISSHLTNPQAIGELPGGFVIIDQTPESSIAFKMDGQGKLLNETNTASTAKFNLTSVVSGRITGIRRFNITNNDQTLIVVDNSGKRIVRINATQMKAVTDAEWRLPAGNFSSTDDIVGACTNGSKIWVAVSDRDVIDTFGGLNSSVNQSEEPIPGTNTAGALDCISINYTSGFFILEDQTSMVYITKFKSNQQIADSINLSNLTGEAFNSFADIAVTTPTDFYAINNISKVAYHFTKRKNLASISPNMTLTFPSAGQEFKTKFSRTIVPINFSVAAAITDADRINCSLYMNNTYNTSLFAINNISKKTTLNITTGIGDYNARIDCIANRSDALPFTAIRVFRVSTFKTIVWMSDNFSLYYDDNANAFNMDWGKSNQTALIVPYNITTGQPVSIRMTWNNATHNRSLYINGDLKGSDDGYFWKSERIDRIYLGSRNDTGQINGIISYFQTSRAVSASNYNPGSYLGPWTSYYKELKSVLKPGYFWQIKSTLRRSLTSEKPTLISVNVSYDETIFNATIPQNLDFSFVSASSSSAPSTQSDALATWSFGNSGNLSFALRAFSKTPFDACFNVMLFNESGRLLPGAANNTINLSTAPRNITKILSPGKNISIWVNVTATNCGSSSEFFDIDFDTFP